MLGTDFSTGSPNWLDLGSPDTDAAAAFYGRGLRLASSSPPGPRRAVTASSSIGGRTVAALGPLTEEGAKSAWMVHFQSPPTSRPPSGPSATAAGRCGWSPWTSWARACWRSSPTRRARSSRSGSPAKTARPGLTSAENTLLWAELHAPDPDAAIAFYPGLFGWRTPGDAGARDDVPGAEHRRRGPAGRAPSAGSRR